MANDKPTCGTCTHRVRGWCKTHKAKVGPRLRACADYQDKARALPLETVRELLETCGVADLVETLEELEDGQRGVRLVPGLDQNLRERVLELVGVSVTPPQRLTLPEKAEQQPAPGRQAGGRAA
ncbi:hypothetical protein TspCOW1_07390 [Thiohalobacter sp. COW1]|uniref:hypothetical protein n=1 Tax=Thiohalobacter sp. COW1 TaxID=2795687 RepID=UPI001915261E|nr:hypothetical protein [Thiohalobacter sp. COW1]BCO30636.1 hypothetical protein TspCOW1_07390 [Thiohalobacter sp. COW1]